MAKYDVDDIVTYYFIIHKYQGNTGEITQIHAWTNNKLLARYYMEFHNCKDLVLKEKTDTLKKIVAITEENVHDEIGIRDLITRDPDNKSGTGWTHIRVPLTNNEARLIDEECHSMLSSSIRYDYLESAIHYLKPKYQRALRDILLIDVISKVLHGKEPNILQHIQLDQLSILYQSFPTYFGAS